MIVCFDGFLTATFCATKLRGCRPDIPGFLCSLHEARDSIIRCSAGFFNGQGEEREQETTYTKAKNHASTN